MRALCARRLFGVTVEMPGVRPVLPFRRERDVFSARCVHACERDADAVVGRDADGDALPRRKPDPQDVTRSSNGATRPLASPSHGSGSSRRSRSTSSFGSAVSRQRGGADERGRQVEDAVARGRVVAGRRRRRAPTSGGSARPGSRRGRGGLSRARRRRPRRSATRSSFPTPGPSCCRARSRRGCRRRERRCRRTCERVVKEAGWSASSVAPTVSTCALAAG